MTGKLYFILGRLTFVVLTLFVAEKAVANEFCASAPSAEYSTVILSVDAAQQSTPNYISQAESGLKKYYPQYEEYFENIFHTINRCPLSIRQQFNAKIQSNLEVYEDDITSEKDKVTTVLMALEKISGKSQLTNDKSIAKVFPGEDGDLREEAAVGIAVECKLLFGKKYNETMKLIDQLCEGTDSINNKRNSGNIILFNELVSDFEKLRVLRDNLLTHSEWFTYNNIGEFKPLKETIQHYQQACKKVGRTPSVIGQKIINEYNKATQRQ